MSAVVKGRGIVWSVGGITHTAGIVSATNPNFLQSVDFDRNSEKAEVKDTGGTIRAVIFHGFKRMLKLSVIPCALSGTNTLANAEAALDAHTLKPGVTVDIVDALAGSSGAYSVLEGGGAAAATTNSYNVINSKQRRTVDGVAIVDLDLEATDEGVDITTGIT